MLICENNDKAKLLIEKINFMFSIASINILLLF